MSGSFYRDTGYKILERLQWYGIVGFNVPFDTLEVISKMILWVKWPNQQCHSTEGRWLVNSLNGCKLQLSMY